MMSLCLAMMTATAMVVEMKASLSLLHSLQQFKERHSHIEFNVQGGARFTVHPSHIIATLEVSPTTTKLTVIEFKQDITVNETFENVQKKLRGE